MALSNNAELLIRGNFAAIMRGQKINLSQIGSLTEKHLAKLNAYRSLRGWEPLTGEIVFHGRHIYNRRIVENGYTIDDVIKQIFTAMAKGGILRITPKMTVIQSSTKRMDGYSCLVCDEVVLECTNREPYVEIYSTIPKGDRLPLVKEKEPQEAALSEKVTNSPG